MTSMTIVPLFIFDQQSTVNIDTKNMFYDFTSIFTNVSKEP